MRKNDAKELNQVKEATQNCTSLMEVSKQTGIKYDRVLYILQFHPIVKERIMKTLKSNRSNKKAEKSNQVNQLSNGRYIIVDASVCGSTEVLSAIYREITENSAKIVLTDITVRELSALEDGEDTSAYTARRILSNASCHPESHIFVTIPNDANSTADENIVNFAATVKEAVLFTADKGMSALARTKNVNVNFFFKRLNSLKEIYKNDGKYLLNVGTNGNKFFIVKNHEHIVYENACTLSDGDIIFSFYRLPDNNGVKLFIFKVKIKSGMLETSFTDKVFLKNYIPQKYKYIYDIFEEKTA